ncbi:hypothetical protein JCM11641_000102 [Rhodosporidiobolus odoratus]
MTSLLSTSTSRSRPARHPLSGNVEWVHARFERALYMVQCLPKSGPIQTSYDQKLLLYSVYKQATEGDIKTSRPGLLDVLGRAKWDAWNKRKGSSQVEAERLYVEALIRILKGYADRTQAVELLRELEGFLLEPRGARVAGHGSTAPSRSSSSHSSSASSTASYEHMPPPPLPSSSRHLHASQYLARSTHSHPARPTPSSSASARGARYRPVAPASPVPAHPAPAPADIVAPALPGYGPPRTHADPLRISPQHSKKRHHHRRRKHDSHSSSTSSSGSERDSSSSSGSESGEEDTRRYHPAPSQRSLPPHPSALPLRPPPPQHLATSIRSVAGSDTRSLVTPSPSGGAQQVAIAYPPSHAAITRISPLTTGNLRATLTTPTSPALSPTPACAPVPPHQQQALDSALQRIQTSLTALHERLSLLESTPPLPAQASHSLSSSSSSSFSSFSYASPLIALRDLLLRLFSLLLRRPRLRSTSPSTSPPSLPTLLLRLLSTSLTLTRRLASDLLVVSALVVLVGRLRGVHVLGGGGAREWVVRWAMRARGQGRVRGAGM